MTTVPRFKSQLTDFFRHKAKAAQSELGGVPLTFEDLEALLLALVTHELRILERPSIMAELIKEHPELLSITTPIEESVSDIIIRNVKADVVSSLQHRVEIAYIRQFPRDFDLFANLRSSAISVIEFYDRMDGLVFDGHGEVKDREDYDMHHENLGTAESALEAYTAEEGDEVDLVFFERLSELVVAVNVLVFVIERNGFGKNVKVWHSALDAIERLETRDGRLAVRA